MPNPTREQYETAVTTILDRAHEGPELSREQFDALIDREISMARPLSEPTTESEGRSASWNRTFEGLNEGVRGAVKGVPGAVKHLAKTAWEGGPVELGSEILKGVWGSAKDVASGDPVRQGNVLGTLAMSAVAPGVARGVKATPGAIGKGAGAVERGAAAVPHGVSRGAGGVAGYAAGGWPGAWAGRELGPGAASTVSKGAGAIRRRLTSEPPTPFHERPLYQQMDRLPTGKGAGSRGGPSPAGSSAPPGTSAPSGSTAPPFAPPTTGPPPRPPTSTSSPSRTSHSERPITKPQQGPPAPATSSLESTLTQSLESELAARGANVSGQGPPVANPRGYAELPVSKSKGPGSDIPGAEGLLTIEDVKALGINPRMRILRVNPTNASRAAIEQQRAIRAARYRQRGEAERARFRNPDE